MKNRQIIAALAIALLALTFSTAFMADGSDAEKAGLNGNIEYSGFEERSDGTIHVTIVNYDSVPITVTVKAVDDSNVSTVYRTTEITIAANEKGVADLTFGLGAGTHTVRVICTPTEYFATDLNSATVTIEVPASIWSGWVPYVTIVIIVIVILGGVYYYMRNHVKAKPDTTFTQLAAEKNNKKDGKEAPAEPKRSATARRRYNSEPEAKTEKTEKSEAKPAEEKPQKLKYVSSRRK